MKKRLMVIMAMVLVVLFGLCACEDQVEALVGGEPEFHGASISREKAKSIALAHAGMQEAEVQYLTVQTDYDDGVPVYEVSFHKGLVEYDYEIHADNGKILSFDVDR